MAGFKSAFAAARKAGKKEFTWNGKSYNTKLKGEGASKKSSLPATTNIKPKARPSQDEGKFAGTTSDDQAKSLGSNRLKADKASAQKRNAMNPFRDRKNSGVAATEGPMGSRSRGGGPYFKGTVGPAKKESVDFSKPSGFSGKKPKGYKSSYGAQAEDAKTAKRKIGKFMLGKAYKG
jgi:hypothetical protein